MNRNNSVRRWNWTVIGKTKRNAWIVQKPYANREKVEVSWDHPSILSRHMLALSVCQRKKKERIEREGIIIETKPVPRNRCFKVKQRICYDGIFIFRERKILTVLFKPKIVSWVVAWNFYWMERKTNGNGLLSNVFGMSSTIKLDAFALVLNRPRSDIYIHTYTYIEIKKKRERERKEKTLKLPSSCIRSRQGIDF